MQKCNVKCILFLKAFPVFSKIGIESKYRFRHNYYKLFSLYIHLRFTFCVCEASGF